MKLSDYVADFLAKLGTKHAFLVTGGAILHIADSVGKHSHIKHVCVQHEQAAAAAADGYFRASGLLGVAMTTSGPGATNLVTNISNAFFDSMPMLCITGQVARFRLRPNENLRQKGFQETDISSVMKSITKYVKLITDPNQIKYELEKAVYIALSGRPGPVVLDIPDDLQRCEIDPDTLPSFVPNDLLPNAHLEEQINQLVSLVKEAQRPVIIYGAGVHSVHMESEARWLARYLNVPVLLTWGAADLFSHDDPLNMGGVGVVGPRAGNFAAQTSDLVIGIGTRLCQMITGGKQEFFAPKAKKVLIDIDQEELAKFGAHSFELHLAIESDLKDFFEVAQNLCQEPIPDKFDRWRALITSWRGRYPVLQENDDQPTDKLNPHVFVKYFSRYARDNEIMIADTGATICWIMQSIETKSHQRIFSAWNHTPMGYALPASIGAALATGRDVSCLIGDGGFMMCLQELATVSRYQLPIKIFLFDNAGQSTVKQSIEIWLEGRYVAVDKESGLNFPDYQKLAEAFDIPYFSIASKAELYDRFDTVWQHTGPCLCHLTIDETHRISPMLKFGAGLENLEPPLPREEILAIYDEAAACVTEPEYV